MEEIQVGEYVRINNDFRAIALGIGKVIKINKETIYVKMNYDLPFSFDIEKVSKHSKKVIDLIEPYDYVNYFSVFDIITYNDGRKEIRLSNGDILENKNIEIIWTKEQLKAIEYNV